ncbi:LemA family protein [Bifidobacterium longum]|uniref:LemA family protein n=1 Tax=Bifidobacterium longum TaxID=216816 RepID=UPI001C23E02B|nr:LemA family protein [Bifidobacterium longum]MBU9071095.1 LemA family protein [Bifidobacterium longum]
MDNKTLKKWMPAGIIVAIVLIIAMILGGTYNGLNTAKLDVDAKWAQVENVMQRRHDLIPNLTNAVKGSMKQEQKVFGAIADARKAYAAATDPNDKLAADRKLGEQTSILVNAIHENYPQLESNKNVKTLMTQLEGSENRISVERKRYIDQVNAYNRQVTSFPANLVAGMFGFQKLQQYEAPVGSDEVPEVNLE